MCGIGLCVCLWSAYFVVLTHKGLWFRTFVEIQVYNSLIPDIKVHDTQKFLYCFQSSPVSTHFTSPSGYICT